MIHLKRDIADIKRFKEILSVIFEEGFSVILENIKLHKFVPIKKRLKKKESRVSHEVRLRKSLERLGPTFIKFGQILSVRPDLVPIKYIHELEKLQDSVAAFSFNEVRKEIEESTGKKLDEIFSKFEKEPIASASIAQVHKAILKNGDIVAVKVRRPNIKEIIETDIEIMRFIAGLIEKHIKELKKYKPAGIVEEFAEWTKKEIDFNIETENILKFYENFKHSKTTKIPKVYEQYCNEKIIVMEFIQGPELHKLEGKKGIDIKEALKNGFYSILEQVFVYGLFHADPHPSNIIVLKDNKIGWVDFGIIGYFDDKLKDKAIDLFIGISEGDTDEVINALLELGEIREGVDLNSLRQRLNEAIFTIERNRLEDIKISRVLEEVLDIALEAGVRIPREFVLFGKAIVTIEGIGLIYYPDFRFHEVAKPFLEKIIAKRYEPRRLIKSSLMSIFSMKKAVEKLPLQATRVLDKLERGKIMIEMRDADIEKLSVELDKSSNRLTYGMIIAALLISGSVTITIGEKLFYGLPLISLMCFAAAGFLGFTLFVSILKERR